MKFGKLIIKYIVNGNVSEEDYEIAKDDMHNNNVMMLRVLSSISSTILLVCSIMGIFVNNMSSKMPVYVAGLAISIAILLSSFFSHNRKLHSLCMYVFDVLLLSVSLLLSLISAPEQLTITLIPVSLLIPLFFDTKPYRFLTVILLSDLVYLIFAPIVKPAEIIALDMIDVLAFSIAGSIIGTILTKVKIERYVYAHKISDLALKDGLTDCMNRTAYNKFIEDNVLDHSENLSAIMIDVNGLKNTNDTIGHEAGDELISTVARIMKQQFVEFGDCYRLGGDEFIVFLKAEDDEVVKLIDSFRRTLKENKGVLINEITVAAGYAFSKDHETIEEMVNEADKKMYADKLEFYTKTGRK